MPMPFPTQALLDEFDRGVISAMKHRGFVLEQTGGGCDAFIRYGQTGTIWITEGHDPSAPRKWNEPVTVGFYPPDEDDSGWTPIAFVQFPSLRMALEHLVHNTDALVDGPPY